MTIVRGDRTIHDELEWINYYNFQKASDKVTYVICGELDPILRMHLT